jgi:hypothetical protein
MLAENSLTRPCSANVAKSFALGVAYENKNPNGTPSGLLAFGIPTDGSK